MNLLRTECRPIRLQEAANYFGVSQKTLMRSAHRGKLKIFKIGGRWFIMPSEIEAYLNRQQKKAFP